MKRIELTVVIDADPEAVFSVQADPESWPRWASHMERLDLLDGSPFGLGSEVRIKPRGERAAVFRVIQYDPPRSFRWEAKVAPGFGMVAGHKVEPYGGGSKVTLSLDLTGPLGAVLAPLLRRKLQTSVEKEAAGLKQFLEAGVPA